MIKNILKIGIILSKKINKLASRLILHTIIIIIDNILIIVCAPQTNIICILFHFKMGTNYIYFKIIIS